VGGQALTHATTAGYSQVASVTSPSGQPDTVTLIFNTPDPDWRSLFAPLIPAHIATAVGFDTGFVDPVTQVVSGGPYEISSYVPGGEITLARNPDWWGPAAELASITFRLLPDQAQAAEGLTMGQLDAAILDYDAGTFTLLKQDTSLQIALGTADGYDDVVFDLHTAALQDPVMRQAIMRAVDRVTLARQAAGSALSTVDNRFFVASEPGFTADATQYQGGDAAAAQGLLAGAGYTLTGSTLSKGGVPITLSIGSSSASPLVPAEERSVEAACAALGITVVGALPGVQPDLLIVERPFTAYLSEIDDEYTTGGGQNLGGYSSGQMDAMITHAQSLAAGTARNAVYTQIDQLAWSDGVDLPLLPYPQMIVYQSRYRGLGPTPAPPGPAWNAQAWNVAAG
ncbi:MAG: ABC transporter substrate-binding protein, partial [Acidimicrobiales bacterium]